MLDVEFLEASQSEVVTEGKLDVELELEVVAEGKLDVELEVVTGGDLVKFECFSEEYFGVNARGELLTAGISIRYLSPDFPFLILSDTLPGKKTVSHSTNLKLIQNYSNINDNNDLE